jgi:hypothetical protein
MPASRISSGFTGLKSPAIMGGNNFSQSPNPECPDRHVIVSTGARGRVKSGILGFLRDYFCVLSLHSFIYPSLIFDEIIKFHSTALVKPSLGQTMMRQMNFS